VRDALETAEHELTTVDNLTVTDRPEAVAEALKRGDKDRADRLTWTTDTSPAIRKIEEALGANADDGPSPASE
jgi:hypothetical protein